MKSALVSVVICAYNDWPYLEMAIQSALCQTYSPLEVIVVDNSSTDATAEEVSMRFRDRLRYIRQANRECAGAYNTGFEAARGEFIQFMDGDDVLAPNKVAKQVETFQANPELDIVYGNVRMFQTSAGIADWRDRSADPEDDLLMRIVTPNREFHAIHTLSILFRRCALEKVGSWDENLYVEDLDYLLRAAWAGCRFGYCGTVPLGFKRLRPGQKTKNKQAMDRGIEAVWVKALSYVTREPYRGLITARLARRRYDIAVSGDRNNKGERLEMLALARATSRDAISRLEYLVGYASIVMPSVNRIARHRSIRPIRRFLAPLIRPSI
jgi:glycosyltransferase involved in cell wall biosynthesis